MGFNSVVVIFNDRVGDKGRSIGAMDDAIRAYPPRHHDQLSTYFGWGQVISCEHADLTQVVVIGENTGKRVQDARDLPRNALEQMAECLRRHGYTVMKTSNKA